MASFLCCWAVVFHVLGWGRGVRCGMVVLGCVVAFLPGGGGTVSRFGGVAGRSWLVLGRCGVALCGLMVVPLLCFSTWAVRVRCGVGLGVPWGGVCGIGVLQPAGFGRVVLEGVGPPVSGPSGAGSAVYGPRAGCHVCGVCGSVGCGVLGVLRPRCGVPGWGWWCVAGMYRLHGGGGAMGWGLGGVRGRLPAGSGCRGLTVGGSFAVSPWCVPWWPLVGWLRVILRVYRIHGGTTVCWRAVVACWGGACVGVVCVVGGGVLCVVLGGSSWWSVVAVRGGWSWAWRFLGGCGTCGVGMVGGGARVCVGSCVRPLLPPRFLRQPFPCLSLCACLFFFGGGLRVVARFQCWAWAWLRAGAGVGVGVGVVGDGWLLRSGLPVCVSALRHLVASGFRGAGPGGAGGGRLAAVVARCLRGWSRLLGSVWVAWPDVGVRVGVFMAWAVWAVGTRTSRCGTSSVGVAGFCGSDGAGCRVCVRRRRGGFGWGTVGDAMGGGDAGDAYGEECCRRRNELVLLMWVLQAMRWAVTGLVMPMVMVS